jgi:kynurenine formamidase
MTDQLIDLTQPVETGMQVFPLHSPTHVLPWVPRERFGWTTNSLFMNEHAGTHLDAPYHFVEGGATIDQLDLSLLTGPAVAWDFSDKWPAGYIDVADLEAAAARRPLERGEALVLWTGAESRQGRDEFLTSNPGLTAAAADYLIDQGVRLVGTDAANIDHAMAEDTPVHLRLLPAGVLIVENLYNLEQLCRVTQGNPFTLHTFPLKVVGGTGSPIRAVGVVHER